MDIQYEYNWICIRAIIIQEDGIHDHIISTFPNSKSIQQECSPVGILNRTRQKKNNNNKYKLINISVCTESNGKWQIVHCRHPVRL